MNTNPGCACARNQHRAQAVSAGSQRASWFGATFGLLTLLFVPKCPLCLAAYLAVLGVSGAVAELLPWLRFSAAVLAVLSCACIALAWARARGRSAAAHET